MGLGQVLGLGYLPPTFASSFERMYARSCHAVRARARFRARVRVRVRVRVSATMARTKGVIHSSRTERHTLVRVRVRVKVRVRVRVSYNPNPDQVRAAGSQRPCGQARREEHLVRHGDAWLGLGLGVRVRFRVC